MAVWTNRVEEERVYDAGWKFGNAGDGSAGGKQGDTAKLKKEVVGTRRLELLTSTVSR